MSTVAFAENFAENVRAAIASRAWSQRELARRAGVHWQTVQKILAGSMVPSADVIEKIATALEIKPEKVFKKPA